MFLVLLAACAPTSTPPSGGTTTTTTTTTGGVTTVLPSSPPPGVPPAFLAHDRDLPLQDPAVTAASAGDVNGDGFDDVIVGAPFYGEGGRVSVYLGAAVDPLTASWTADSDQPDALFGVEVSSAGDVNGDGFDDVLVSATGWDDGALPNAGRVALYLGSVGGLAPAPASEILGQSWAEFGSIVAAAGDVNGDGYGDVLIGSRLYDGAVPGGQDEGALFLHLGSASGLGAAPAWQIESNVIAGRFPTAAAAAGDVNGDGYDDVIVADDDALDGADVVGAASLYLGSGAGLAATPEQTLLGEDPYAFFGRGVAGAGDVDGDGFDDVLVTRGQGETHYEGGATWLYRGSAAGLVAAGWGAEGPSPFARTTAPAPGGDVNGDGRADLLIGGATTAALYLGAPLGLEASAAWTAAGFGPAPTTVDARSAGDVNGDGLDDILVADPKDGGIVHVYVAGCAGPDSDGDLVPDACDACPGADDGLIDADHDGACGAADCDDADRASFPGAAEACDGRDNACLGALPADELDGDGDGQLPCEGDVDDGAPLWSPGWTWSADGWTARSGGSVAAAGDVNGDGFDDLMVGAPAIWPTSGTTHVLHGSATGPSNLPDWSTQSVPDDSQFGASVASAGDINADGFDDVIIGDWASTCCSANDGYAELHLGSALGVRPNASWSVYGDDQQNFGRSVAPAGDVDGDGFDDVAVGAYDEVLVYRGSATGLKPTPVSINGPAGSAFGWSVAPAGDVNGDGFSDLYVGASEFGDGETREGAAYLVLGGPSGLSLDWSAQSDQAFAGFGTSVATAGDVNGDGFADLLVGAPSYDGAAIDEGKVFVYLGTATGPGVTASWSLAGGGAGALFGASVAPAGDVDGDGFDDVLVGAPGTSVSQAQQGRALLYRGGASGLTLAWAVVGQSPYAALGASVASAGDVDGDGRPDVLVGAPAEEVDRLDQGRVYLFYGQAP